MARLLSRLLFSFLLCSGISATVVCPVLSCVQAQLPNTGMHLPVLCDL
jgi:hypothetical protein